MFPKLPPSQVIEPVEFYKKVLEIRTDVRTERQRGEQTEDTKTSAAESSLIETFLGDQSYLGLLKVREQRDAAVDSIVLDVRRPLHYSNICIHGSRHFGIDELMFAIDSINTTIESAGSICRSLKLKVRKRNAKHPVYRHELTYKFETQMSQNHRKRKWFYHFVNLFCQYSSSWIFISIHLSI